MLPSCLCSGFQFPKAVSYPGCWQWRRPTFSSKRPGFCRIPLFSAALITNQRPNTCCMHPKPTYPHAAAEPWKNQGLWRPFVSADAVDQVGEKSLLPKVPVPSRRSNRHRLERGPLALDAVSAAGGARAGMPGGGLGAAPKLTVDGLWADRSAYGRVEYCGQSQRNTDITA